MVLKRKVQGYVEELSHHIKTSFGVAGTRVSLAIIVIGTISPHLILRQLSIIGLFGTVFGRKKNVHNELLKRLFELGHSNEQIVNEILALLVGVTVELSLGRCNRFDVNDRCTNFFCSLDKRS